MAEETKTPPTEPVKPAAVAKPAVPAAVAEKLSAEALYNKLKAELKMAEKQLADKSNYGEGKTGTIKFRMPMFDPSWKIPSFKTFNKTGLKRVYVGGQTYNVTWAEAQDLLGRFGTRFRFETIARTAREPISVDVSDGNLF